VHFLWWSAGFPEESSPLCWGQWGHSQQPPGWSRETKQDHVICLLSNLRNQGPEDAGHLTAR
jgi:hypothetical protein